MKIVWNSFSGRYSDSPRALYEALLGRGDEFSHVWLVRPDRLGDFPSDVATVVYGSPEGRAALESADIVVANNGISLDWDKQPGATYLQTWHGTPLKRMHQDVSCPPAGRLAALDADVARWDHLLSPNAASTPRLRSAFGYRGPVHETGYPRNDVLSFPERDRLRAEVRARLGIADGVTAVLYTPTWRDDLVLAVGRPDHAFPPDFDELVRGLPADHVLLLRLHTMVSDRPAVAEGAPVLDVSDHPDVRYLYLAADVLVTDYSSTMFDFAVTGRPIIHFTYDIEHYRDELRGFYFDLAEAAPGPLLTTSAEVLAALADADREPAERTARYARFRQTFCSLEDGRATDRVIARFFPPAAAGPNPLTTPAPQTERGDEHAHR
ncbi:CDP-glycerol:poly(glycerophosphate) glycerophosphotransferase [Modestobacter sp. DSM 44400]|uniref:CDP-glycerol glycerophosphotransferase family protein n=1 Tax=Modestobacter sp. DSM 44400 TaxID=1550230 RepID=UPI00089B4D97|nr:CDP-glycerol glycerophosphotransferase family protein [Modestobacter sp. DSM 44400]SDY40792.1 CDP-glycerol:poly(glycerophosphate) glycerophosphotransferase [Modestobacter sp. DSM 44400]